MLKCSHQDLPWPDNFNQDCVICAAGDPEELHDEGEGVFRAVYEDGSEGYLRQHEDGWHFIDAYRTDCATATGMYDGL